MRSTEFAEAALPNVRVRHELYAQAVIEWRADGRHGVKWGQSGSCWATAAAAATAHVYFTHSRLHPFEQFVCVTWCASEDDARCVALREEGAASAAELREIGAEDCGDDATAPFAHTMGQNFRASWHSSSTSYCDEEEWRKGVGERMSQWQAGEAEAQ